MRLSSPGCCRMIRPTRADGLVCLLLLLLWRIRRPDLMPGYSAHQFCRRTARGKRRCGSTPTSHHARLDWFVFCASASTLVQRSPFPALSWKGTHDPRPTTHDPRSFHLSRASLNQSITQSTKPNSSVVFNSRLSFCAHLHPHSINHDGQIFFSTVIVDCDRCAFHRRVCYSRSHCNQGMRSSKQDVVKRVPSI